MACATMDDVDLTGKTVKSLFRSDTCLVDAGLCNTEGIRTLLPHAGSFGRHQEPVAGGLVHCALVPRAARSTLDVVVIRIA